MFRYEPIEWSFKKNVRDFEKMLWRGHCFNTLTYLMYLVEGNHLRIVDGQLTFWTDGTHRPIKGSYIAQAMAWLQERGFIKYHRNKKEYSLTLYGKFALKRYQSGESLEWIFIRKETVTHG